MAKNSKQMTYGMRKLAATYLGKAHREKDPQTRGRILRQAAVEFGKLASDPRNREHREQLTAIGLEFAGAAAPMFQPQAPGLNHDAAVNIRAMHALSNLYPEGLEHADALGEGSSIPALSQRMSIQPATFTEETTLGRYATVKFQPSADEINQGITQLVTVAMWQGKKVESQAMTVDVGTVLVPQSPPTKGVFARPFASIQYGADGNIQNMVTIDVGLGKRVTVVGNYISVSVGMDAPPPNQSALAMTIGATIGSFAAPTPAPTIRTVYCDGLVAGAIFANSPQFAVPLRATRMFPPLLLADDTITITFLNIVGIPISAWTCTYSATTRFQEPVVIPGEAFFIVAQVGQAANAFLRVPFELSL